MGEGTIRPPARSREGGRMGEQKQTERQTEPIDRKFGGPLPPVGAWLPVKQQARASQQSAGSQHPEEKAIGQGNQQEQFAARLPVAQTQGFNEQFGFLKAELFLNFPARDVGEGDLPSLLFGLNRFIAEQIPRLASFALAPVHQPQASLIIWMTHGQCSHTCSALYPKICNPPPIALPSPPPLAPL